MANLEAIWPPYAVRVTSGDLSLSVVTDDDLPGLVDLVLAGVHPPDQMPFAVPWTDAEPDRLPAALVRYYSSVRAQFSPERFSLLFAVRWGDQLVGVQGFETEEFRVTRTGETGSWLSMPFHGQGIGTRMRRAVCGFAFDHLGALEITSAAFADNPASLAVSRKLGYCPNGRARVKRRPGEVAISQRLVLTPETFVRGEPIAVTGAAALRAFVDC
jgi:RimJ/RimL family protein N-acetyltransferase